MDISLLKIGVFGARNRNIDQVLYHVNEGRQPMNIPLTRREIEFIIGWKQKAFWPDEERVLKKLRRALGNEEALRMSRLQVQIVFGWGEDQVSGHYGGGQIGNPEEQAIMDKLRGALEEEAQG